MLVSFFRFLFFSLLVSFSMFLGFALIAGLTLTEFSYYQFTMILRHFLQILRISRVRCVLM